MQRKIKVIWDFRGSTSAKVAEHHVAHLKEYISQENLLINTIDFEIITDFHSIAYMVVTDELLLQIRDNLKPHRAEVAI